MNTTNYKKQVDWFTTENDKKMSMMAMGVCCIMAGGVATSLVGMPLVGHIFNATGVYSIVYDIFNKTNSHRKLFDALGLYVGKGEDKVYPRLKERKKMSYGECLKFKMPTGLSSEDFNKHKVTISEEFRCEHIEIKRKNKWLFIELHNTKLEEDYEFSLPENKTKSIIRFPIGYSIKGLEWVTLDESNPHLLLAGRAGSGKSVILRGGITYLIMNGNPDALNLRLADGKSGAEFNIFRNNKMVKSFCKDVDEIHEMLVEMDKEIDRRYELFYETDSVDIVEYNKKHKKNKLPYELIMIDEMAELMNEKESLKILERVSQKARACGIHLIAATQRPDAQVVTGRIKANFSIIAGLQTLNRTNSEIIWDGSGLEKLRGKGHGLLRCSGKEVEFQSMYLSKEQARDILKSTMSNEDTRNKNDNKGTFIPKQKVIEMPKKTKAKGKVKSLDWLDGEVDER